MTKMYQATNIKILVVDLLKRYSDGLGSWRINLHERLYKRTEILVSVLEVKGEGRGGRKTLHKDHWPILNI